jgi:hypothetical protein
MSDGNAPKSILETSSGKLRQGKVATHSTEVGNLGMVASPHTSICTTGRLKLTTDGLFHTIQFYGRCFRPTLMLNGATL